MDGYCTEGLEDTFLREHDIMKTQRVERERPRLDYNYPLIILSSIGVVVVEIVLLLVVLFADISKGLKIFFIVFMIFLFLGLVLWLVFYTMKRARRSNEEQPVLSTDECRLASDKILFFRERFAVTKNLSDRTNREVFRLLGKGQHKIPIYVRSVRGRWTGKIATVIIRADDVIIDKNTGERRPRLYSISYDLADKRELDMMVESLVGDTSDQEDIKDFIARFAREVQPAERFERSVSEDEP